MVYFYVHSFFRPQERILDTAQRILQMQFSYQDICYLPHSFFICLFFAVLLGMLLRGFWNLLEGKACRFCLGRKRKSYLFLIFSLSCFVMIGCYSFSFSGVRSMVINEVCGSNQTYYLDAEGTLSDYVELYNTGSLPCELQNMYLSDDEEDLNKEQVPFCVVPAGGHVLVKLNHGAFSVSRQGSDHILLSASGRILDQVHTKATEEDFAYARSEDGCPVWEQQSCTPGFSNSFAFQLPGEPVLSHKSGFYEDAFDLVISSDPGTRVYYTLDGSIPTEESILYETPIPVYDRSPEENVHRANEHVTPFWVGIVLEKEPVDKAFFLRAVAVGEDGRRSDVVTATYFIDLEKYRQNPVLSIVADEKDLFGDEGIYVTGATYDDWYLGGQNGDAPTPFFYKRGRKYEIPAYIEYFSEDLSFAQTVGMRISGSSSRELPLKRFSLFARKEYNGSRIFEENLFGNVSSHKLSLRGGFANALCQKLVEDRDVAVQRSVQVSVFLNGEFWYHTNIFEKYDARYFEEYYGMGRDNLVVMNNGGVNEGTEEDGALIQELYDFLNSHSLADTSHYETFMDMIDVQSYIDYMCINTYIDNMDISETKNVIMWRSREKTSNGYEDGRWRWSLYDLDAMEWRDAADWNLEAQEEKNSFVLTQKYAGGYALRELPIYRELKENPAFRRQYVLTFMDLVNQNFRYERVKEVMDSWSYDLEDFQVGYGGTQDMGYYDSFFRNRASYIVPYMAEEFGLSGTLEDVTLSVNDVEGGYIQLNTIRPDFSENGTWSGAYYTDYPVTATAVAGSGYVFLGWEGDARSGEACVEVPVKEGGMKLHAVFERVE